MAWSNVKKQIQIIADDKTFEPGGKLYNYLIGWANNIQLEVANSLEILDHLKTVEGDLDTSNHAWFLPGDYLKTSTRFTKVRVGDINVPIIGLEQLNDLDPDHSDISNSAAPQYAAIEGGVIYLYPKWQGTLVIENYIRQPAQIAGDDSEIDIPEKDLAEDLIINGVLGKYCFPLLNELELAKLYYDGATGSGRFFQLLGQMERRLKGQRTVWSNRGRYY